MESEDGRLFIKNLAYYIRTHEKALANALQHQRQQPSRGSAAEASRSRPPTTSSVSSIASQRGTPAASTSAFSSLSLSYFGLTSQNVKAAKLYLTPNQLYYLLSRFEELGVSVGPLNVRLESIHADSTSMNYVSFLNQTKRPKGRSSDQDSLHSVSSVRSVMSSMSSMLSSFNLSSNSAAKTEKRRAAELEDIRYLYSAFTKIPCLKLVFDHRIRRISGYEEFPFDTAVPVFVFKNLTVLEIVDQDFRSFFGWDRLAEQLRSLTVKRAEIDDPTDLLSNIVLDDADKRRRRSTKNQASPTMPYSTPSPALKQAEAPRGFAVADASPIMSQSPSAEGAGVEVFSSSAASQSRLQSVSPSRPNSGRMSSSKIQRRLSTSSTSSGPAYTPRNSSSNLLSSLGGGLPANKWRFLRHLSLADNGLTTISSQSLQSLVGSLVSLDLSSNLFTEIPDSLSALVALRALNLSNCMIESLHTLTRSPLPAITVMNLKGNRITSIAGIEKLLSLERIDLRGNNLKDPTEIARLTGMPDFQDVYVARNPFTKTHSNFRITIFNLFRQAPGYTEDITIDSTGPGFSERRHLTGRVPEAASVPVIRPPFEDDEPAPDARTEPVKPANGNFVTNQGGGERPHTPEEDRLSMPSRRRKGPRRRVVDMAQDESPRSPGSIRSQDASPETTFVSAVQTTASPSAHRRRVTEDLTVTSAVDDAGGARRENTGSLKSSRMSGELPAVERDRPISHERAPSPGSSGEQYRKRVEALKKEYGNGWLGALRDDKWNENATMSYGTNEVGQNGRQSLAKT